MYPKEACDIGIPRLEMSSPVQVGSITPIKVSKINPNSDYVLWFIDGQTFVNGKFPTNYISAKNGISTASFSVQLDNVPGTKTLCLKHGSTTLGFGKDNCEVSIPIEVTTLPPQSTTVIQSSQPGASLEESTLFSEPTPTYPPPPCAEGCFKDGKCTCVDTAIGRISTNPAEFVKSVFSLVLGLSGGIALILIIFSGYKLIASQGNPEKTTAARDQLISAIVGLLFIIVSFVILEVIGVDILKIPGFSE
ncbi:MAG: hypothetical protein A3C22_00830 [Candidatus Levybacteria bacterium RIFCSPHIGHO2_02_FULL_37_10]|nr:MAG: hypothetical protein A3C22_00830 [Candidatus Levybacteria bacterium RIFCSPHIGHO2_02_FULL_37_10]